METNLILYKSGNLYRIVTERTTEAVWNDLNWIVPTQARAGDWFSRWYSNNVLPTAEFHAAGLIAEYFPINLGIWYLRPSC